MAGLSAAAVQPSRCQKLRYPTGCRLIDSLFSIITTTFTFAIRIIGLSISILVVVTVLVTVIVLVLAIVVVGVSVSGILFK